MELEDIAYKNDLTPFRQKIKKWTVKKLKH